MPSEWPALPYDAWSATCDTLHAHTQVLGKLAVALAPPEPQLQHAALRLTVRGWETLPLPAPDGSGALTVALDLRTHQAVAEHSDGRGTPSRSKSGGGPAMDATRGPPSSRTRIPRPRTSLPPSCHRRPLAGTPGWANTCSTGTTPAPARIRTVPRGLWPPSAAAIVMSWII